MSVSQTGSADTMKKNIGYWRVGDNLFQNKVNAILEAQKTQQEISFHYNDEWWDRVDWTREPSESIALALCSYGTHSVNLLNQSYTCLLFVWKR